MSNKLQSHCDNKYCKLADELHNHTKKHAVDTSAKAKPEVVTKSKKSHIPKREQTGRLSQEVVPSPEVKNAVKGIIKLLKGLDNISGGTINPAEEDEPLSALPANASYDPKFEPSSSNTGGHSSRSVRISTIILKHEDPQYLRATFETFDPEFGESTVRTKEKKGPESARVKEDEESKKLVKEENVTKPVISGEQSSLPIRKELTARKVVPKFVKIQPLKVNHNIAIKKQIPNVASRSRRRGDTHVQDKNADILDLIKSYKNASQVDEITNNNEEKFYSYKHSVVYKEPNLNIFLPLNAKGGDLWQRGSLAHDMCPPENFGAPYFRLDGSMMVDVNVNRSNNINIQKFVKNALHEQQALYQEATDIMRPLKKKLIEQKIISNNSNKTKSRCGKVQ